MKLPEADDIHAYGMALIPWAGIIAGLIFVTAFSIKGCGGLFMN